MKTLPPPDIDPVALNPLRTRLAQVAFNRTLWIARDLACATWLNRASNFRFALWPMALVSRLGDGVLWYLLMAALAVFGGSAGRHCAALMAITGLSCLLIYVSIKKFTARPRPFVHCRDIRACTRVLDQFSFPSGHTLHGVAFTLIIVDTFPSAAWLLWPLTAVIAFSRVALGLHYPSDVLAGAAIGWSVAMLAMNLWSLALM